MLIKCGPRILRPKLDWGVGLRSNRPTILPMHGTKVFGASVNIAFDRLCELCDAAARAYGFEVNSVGHITNWDCVPYLWNLPDVN